MDQPDVDLALMTEDDYVHFKDRVIRDYAEESMVAGRIDDGSALEWARKEIEKFLPDGTSTKDMMLLRIVSHQHPGATLGTLWCEKDSNNPANAFIYDLFLYPEHRGQGHGIAAMTKLESVLREDGYKAVGLHVYAHNQAAASLYRKIGYHATSLNLRKELQNGASR